MRDIFLLVLIVSLSACASSPKSDDPRINGTWTFISATCEDGTATPILRQQNDLLKRGIEKDLITFKDGYIFRENHYLVKGKVCAVRSKAKSVIKDFTYTVISGEITHDGCGGASVVNTVATHKYDISGDILKLYMSFPKLDSSKFAKGVSEYCTGTIISTLKRVK